MSFSDTATSLMSAYNRQSPNELASYYTSQTNSIREATVIKVGPMENLEGSLIVHINGLNEVYKTEAPLGNGVSSISSTGQFTPYFKGDRVLVAFLYGNERPTVIGRVSSQVGVSEYLQEDEMKIPDNGSVTKSGVIVQPNPLALSPEFTKCGGFLSMTSYPMVTL